MKIQQVDFKVGDTVVHTLHLAVSRIWLIRRANQLAIEQSERMLEAEYGERPVVVFHVPHDARTIAHS